MACGPGRVASTARRETPMKFKQRIPDVDEVSLQASGEYVGRVERGSEAYKDLETNYNSDIVFRTDNNDDNRRMTKNCMKKLNFLASLVKDKWGIRLRVIEAYDLDRRARHHHGIHSLHHEGRAVDIATEDKDKDKYPFLGRLAIQAGFDWVLYATKGYIHASVKTDEDAAEEGMSCFPEDATVRLEGGRTKKMKELRVGDKVAGLDGVTGRVVYSRVMTFLDIKPNSSNTFITIRTKTPAAEVAITESHLIYQLNKQAQRETAVFARDLKVGDFVYVRHGTALEKFTAGRVVGIKSSRGKGAYAPLTETGNIVVNDVLCSCYAMISDQRVAHWSFAPLRFAEWLFPGIAAQNSSGVHWYAEALYKIYTSWNYVTEDKI